MDFDEIVAAIALAKNAESVDEQSKKFIGAVYSASGTYGSAATFVSYETGKDDFSLIASVHRRTVLIDIRNAVAYDNDDKKYLVGKVALRLVEGVDEETDIYCDIKVTSHGTLAFDGHNKYSLNQLNNDTENSIKDTLSAIILIAVQQKLVTT